jgi:hypothetical protein
MRPHDSDGTSDGLEFAENVVNYLVYVVPVELQTFTVE